MNKHLVTFVAYCKKNFPWWLKIAIKMVLYRLPVGQKFWRIFAIFEPGAMADCKYAYSQFDWHYNAINQKVKPPFTCLELGPGDSLFSGLIANAFGAEKCWLVNAGDLAIDDPASYNEMAKLLRNKGYTIPETPKDVKIDEFLDAYNINYLTEGVQSLKQVPDSSVDMIYSQAVLEHVYYDEMEELLSEFKRILKPNGIMSHRIDLMDHLDHALNNLRFSHDVWEGKLFRGSGFYTNRICYPKMMQMFEDAGFSTDDLIIDKWEELPTPRKYIHEEFLPYSDDDLRVRTFCLTLQHA